MRGKFYPPPSNFPQSDFGRRADSGWALPQISSLNLKSSSQVYSQASYMYGLKLSSAAEG